MFGRGLCDSVSDGLIDVGLRTTEKFEELKLRILPHLHSVTLVSNLASSYQGQVNIV
jgi:hypothetical protein